MTQSTDSPTPSEHPQRRVEDRHWLQRATCWVALRLKDFWDFVDNRQIDVHLISWGFFGLTAYAVYWSMEYAWAHPEKSGIDVAAVCAAVTLPLTWIMPSIVDKYMKARHDSV